MASRGPKAESGRRDMRLLRRALEVWVATPKWWKGFYVTFLLALLFLIVSTGDATFATRWAFVWALTVAAALWASERLKARMRDGDAGPAARRRR